MRAATSRLLCLLVWLACLTALAGAEASSSAGQLAGVIHAHSTYSDNKTFANADVLQDLAAADGYSFVFVTDHIDQLDKIRGVLKTKFVSFDQYVQRCWWLNQDSRHRAMPTMVAGEEFSLTGKHFCHVLILGLMYEGRRGYPFQYWRLPEADVSKPSWVVKSVAARCRELESVGKSPVAAVVAHPHEWEGGRPPSDVAEIRGFTSVEFINNTGAYFGRLASELKRLGHPSKRTDLWLPSYLRRIRGSYPEAERAADKAACEADSADLSYYLELMRLDKEAGHCMLLGVTGGSDAHVTAYMDRTTRIFAPSRSIGDLMRAILSRRTYASYKGCQICDLTHPLGLAEPYAANETETPWTESQALKYVPLQNRVSRVDFGCRIAFPRDTDCSIFVYRDGVDCASALTVTEDAGGAKLQLHDPDVAPGHIYAYTLVVKAKSSPRICLVASPLLFYVRPNVGSGGSALPASTVFVLDCSGSMSSADAQGKAKIDGAKTTAEHYLFLIEQDIEQSRNKHQVGIVSFSSRLGKCLELTVDTAKVREILTSLEPTERTNYGDALNVAVSWFEELRDDSKSGEKTMFFLSDGGTNEGPISRDEFDVGDPAQLELYTRIKNAGVKVYTVGFGNPSQSNVESGGLDESILRRIASVPGTGGEYKHASNAHDLDRIYVTRYHSSTGKVFYEQAGRVLAQGQRVELDPFNPASARPKNTAAVSGSPMSIFIAPVYAETEHKGQMLITMVWSDGSVELQLKDPSGRVVDENYPGAHIKTTDKLLYMSIDSPQAGNWKSTVTGNEVPPGGIDFSVVASARMSLASGAGGGTGSDTVAVAAAVLTSLAILSCISVGVLALKRTAASRVQRRYAPAPPASAVIGQLYNPLSRRALQIGATPVLIGRSSQCTVRLDLPDVSRKHALVSRRGDSYVVEDLGSRTGTCVNGTRCSQQVLRDGDLIMIGSVELQFVMDRTPGRVE